MAEARVVTPQEAQDLESELERHPAYTYRYDDLLHTVATEPERMRAAVVGALRDLGRKYGADWALHEAAALENGAPL